MAQDWLTIANMTQAAAETDAIPKMLESLRTCHSGATEPSNTVAYMLWADSSAGLLKIRNSADTDWIALGPLGGTWNLWTPDKERSNITTSVFALFHAPQALTIVDICLEPDATTSGSDGSNHYSFDCINRGTDGTGTTSLFATAPTTNGSEPKAKVGYLLGPDQNLTVAENEVLEVQINVIGSGPVTTDWTTAYVGIQIIGRISG